MNLGICWKLRVQERTGELQVLKEELEAINEELRVELEFHKKLEVDHVKAREAAETSAEAKAAFLATINIF